MVACFKHQMIMYTILLKYLRYDFALHLLSLRFKFHCFPEGYYVYIEASSRRQNESAQIKSPQVSPSTGSNTRCLTFWYSMFGANIGALNLYTQTQAILGNPVWKRRGNQGNQWRQAQVTVSLVVPFNVSISSSWFLAHLS